ncbi:MAG: hypothetical protein JF606_19470 [Burkholderiales bacterium]|nr:hypothetical protein [Burkholderiales bacterium]
MRSSAQAGAAPAKLCVEVWRWDSEDVEKGQGRYPGLRCGCFALALLVRAQGLGEKRKRL